MPELRRLDPAAAEMKVRLEDEGVGVVRGAHRIARLPGAIGEDLVGRRVDRERG
jgi:hypothetical protein